MLRNDCDTLGTTIPTDNFLVSIEAKLFSIKDWAENSGNKRNGCFIFITLKRIRKNFENEY